MRQDKKKMFWKQIILDEYKDVNWQDGYSIKQTKKKTATLFKNIIKIVFEEYSMVDMFTTVVCVC